MSSDNEKHLQPMTESMYYILLSLLEPKHGYGIILHVRALTGGRVLPAAGTVYNSLTKLVRDGLITHISGRDRRKLYLATEKGRAVLGSEVERLRELMVNGENALGAFYDKAD